VQLALTRISETRKKTTAWIGTNCCLILHKMMLPSIKQSAKKVYERLTFGIVRQLLVKQNNLMLLIRDLQPDPAIVVLTPLRWH